MRNKEKIQRKLFEANEEERNYRCSVADLSLLGVRKICSLMHGEWVLMTHAPHSSQNRTAL